MPKKKKIQTIVLMGVALCVLGFLSYKPSNKKEETPNQTTIEADYEPLDENESGPIPLSALSPVTLRANLSYALSLVYTYSPLTAAQRFNEFTLFYVDPGQQKNLQAVLAARLNKLQANNVGQILETTDFEVIPKMDSAVLKANLLKYDVSSKQILSEQPLHVQITFYQAGDRTYISSMNTMSADDFNRAIASVRNP